MNTSKRLLIFLLILSSSIVSGQTLTQQDTLSRDTVFIGRVKISMVRAAISISNELASAPNHNNRLPLAKKVIQDPDTWSKTFTTAVVADTTITSASTDAVINTRVDVVWDSLASVQINCVTSP
jgi:hypothetical protein